MPISNLQAFGGARMTPVHVIRRGEGRMKRLVCAAAAATTISLAVVASAAAGDANGLHNRFAHADVRESPAAQQALAQRAAALSASPSAAAVALKDSLD